MEKRLIKKSEIFSDLDTAAKVITNKIDELKFGHENINYTIETKSLPESGDDYIEIDLKEQDNEGCLDTEIKIMCYWKYKSNDINSEDKVIYYSVEDEYNYINYSEKEINCVFNDIDIFINGYDDNEDNEEDEDE